MQQGGFASGHLSTSYLATLAQLMDDASDAPEVRAALAAVAEALSEDRGEEEGEPAIGAAWARRHVLLPCVWGSIDMSSVIVIVAFIELVL